MLHQLALQDALRAWLVAQIATDESNPNDLDDRYSIIRYVNSSFDNEGEHIISLDQIVEPEVIAEHAERWGSNLPKDYPRPERSSSLAIDFTQIARALWLPEDLSDRAFRSSPAMNLITKNTDGRAVAEAHQAPRICGPDCLRLGHVHE